MPARDQAAEQQLRRRVEGEDTWGEVVFGDNGRQRNAVHGPGGDRDGLSWLYCVPAHAY